MITIFHFGSTHETVTRLAKEAGATTICITNYGKSPLLAHVDIVLNTMARETQFRTGAMTSRIAQLAIVGRCHDLEGVAAAFERPAVTGVSGACPGAGGLPP